VEQAANDRRFANATVKVSGGGTMAAIEEYADASTPDLIMLEVTGNRDVIVNELNSLAEVCDSGTKVIIVGQVNDIILYRELMAMGVSEYLVAPLSYIGVMESISGLYNSEDGGKAGHVISFIGSRGGCGSSTICQNTAWELAKMVSSNITLIDMDMPFGTAAMNLDVGSSNNIADAFASDSFDDMMLPSLLTKCTDNLSLIASPASLRDTWSFPDQAVSDTLGVLQRSLPLVMFDLPHTWNPLLETIISNSDELIIITPPDLTGLRNTKNIMRALGSRGNDSPARLVINKVSMPGRKEIPPEDFSRALETVASATIKFDVGLFTAAADNSRMISEEEPNAAPVQAFRTLAKLATNPEEKVTDAKGASAADTGGFMGIINALKDIRAR
jgi:pilus assembly protein CpaE